MEKEAAAFQGKVAQLVRDNEVRGGWKVDERQEAEEYAVVLSLEDEKRREEAGQCCDTLKTLADSFTDQILTKFI